MCGVGTPAVVGAAGVAVAEGLITPAAAATYGSAGNANIGKSMTGLHVVATPAVVVALGAARDLAAGNAAKSLAAGTTVAEGVFTPAAAATHRLAESVNLGKSMKGLRGMVSSGVVVVGGAARNWTAGNAAKSLAAQLAVAKG